MCGTGVTSRMLVTLSPAALSARMAASRPEPGPRTRTSTCLRPCSMPLRAALSPARWAANAVDLREPLKPTVPALPHAMTLPWGSVRVIRVLLKVDWIYARPTGIDLRSRLLVRGFFAMSFLCYLVTVWRLPATGMRRPRLARAFVLER